MDRLSGQLRASALYTALGLAFQQSSESQITLEFGAGGWGYLAQFPSIPLAEAREWLVRRRSSRGLFPLVAEESDAFLTDFSNPRIGTSAEILAEADRLGTEYVVEQFRSRGNETLDEWSDEPERSLSSRPGDSDFWLASHAEPSVRYWEPACLALIPADTAVEVFASVGVEFANSIDRAEHLAMMRYFEETMGFELISLSGDGYGLRMPSPITDREVAVDLATVLIGYADSSDPGGTRRTLSELASYLLVGRYLRLWWD